MLEMEDLIAIFAEYNEIGVMKAMYMYENGEISKKELLEAYLFMEGIFGYTDTLWSIFETLK